MVASAVVESLVFIPLSRGDLSGEGRSAAQAVADAELSRAARSGDSGAFGRLVVQNERAVFGLCLRFLRDREEARDAAQEAFVRAYESLASYDAALPFTPWLLRIARNHCLDLLRRGKTRPALLREGPGAPGSEDGGRHEVADPDAQRADDALVQAEDRTQLAAAIARLPDDHREALMLFHQEQLSYREIAAVLDVPIGTVMTWLHRARQKLRAELQEAVQ
jgi:RNA polymerase sigma-70 factor, ECF subfamily